MRHDRRKRPSRRQISVDLAPPSEFQNLDRPPVQHDAIILQDISRLGRKRRAEFQTDDAVADRACSAQAYHRQGLPIFRYVKWLDKLAVMECQRRRRAGRRHHHRIVPITDHGIRLAVLHRLWQLQFNKIAVENLRAALPAGRRRQLLLLLLVQLDGLQRHDKIFVGVKRIILADNAIGLPRLQNTAVAGMTDCQADPLRINSLRTAHAIDPPDHGLPIRHGDDFRIGLQGDRT